MSEEEKVEQKEENCEWVVLSGNQIISVFPNYEEAFSHMLAKNLHNPRVIKSVPGKAMEAFNVYIQTKKIFG
jgi:hypothetical protein